LDIRQKIASYTLCHGLDIWYDASATEEEEWYDASATEEEMYEREKVRFHNHFHPRDDTTKL
jgi:hypothetical protein